MSNDELKLIVLDSKEKARLDELCGVVDRGIKTFFEVGMALAEIKESKLYRETHPTFEDFCRDKWEIGKSYVRYQINAAYVTQNLHNCGSFDVLPVNESQVRPLTEFESDTQRELWQMVVDRSIENGDGKITAALVSSVVADYLRKKSSDKLNQTRKNVSRETVIAPVFKERFQGFLDVVSDEINTGFKNTSRTAVLQHIDAVRELVAGAK